MELRKFRFSLALPLLLVLAQQGAVLHELGHLHGGGSDQPRYEQTLDAGKPCAICLAFAQVGNPASASIAILTPAAAVHQYTPEPIYSIVAAEALTPRCRGPPRI